MSQNFDWTKTFFSKIHFLAENSTFWQLWGLYKLLTNDLREYHFVKINKFYVWIDKFFSRWLTIISLLPKCFPDSGEYFWYSQQVQKTNRKFFQIHFWRWKKIEKAFFFKEDYWFIASKKLFGFFFIFKNGFEKIFCLFSEHVLSIRNILQSQGNIWVTTRWLLVI